MVRLKKPYLQTTQSHFPHPSIFNVPVRTRSYLGRYLDLWTRGFHVLL